MYREFFNSFLPVERRSRARQHPEDASRSLGRRLTGLMIPGPPGGADHAMHLLALAETRGGRSRGAKRGKRHG